jgi:DNA-binding winged helix-turn-helix (wHTH) protein
MSLSIRELYRFGDFELDPSRRTFLRNGTPVLVSPKAFEVLTFLVTNPGRVVTKNELLKAVWPDSFVEESNLAQHISWLRKALADRSKYIVTVPGRGYQFTATVQTEPDLSPAKQHGDIHVQRTRERTHVVIEELAPASASASEAVSATVRPATPGPSRTQLAASKPWVWKNVVPVGALVLVAIVAGYFSYKKFGNALFHRTTSIAVLPFTNLTGDPAKEYLSDGVTEEMINGLARAEGSQLRVIARTSSMSYKDTRKAVGDIASNRRATIYTSRRSSFAAAIKLIFGRIALMGVPVRFWNLKTASPAPSRTPYR